MNKLILTAAAAALLVIGSTEASAGHRYRSYWRTYYYYPCTPMVQPAPEAVPPAAPADGQTQQSRSVEPQAAPPVAPRAGTTYRSYSVEPAPSFQPAPQPSRGSSGYSPDQRHRPSNRLKGPGNF